MEVSGAHEMVVTGRMVFCVIVTLVGASWIPVDKELFLMGPVLDVVKTH